MNKRTIGVCRRHLQAVDSINNSLLFFTQWILIFVISVLVVRHYVLVMPVVVVFFVIDLFNFFKGEKSE